MSNKVNDELCDRINNLSDVDLLLMLENQHEYREEAIEFALTEKTKRNLTGTENSIQKELESKRTHQQEERKDDAERNLWVASFFPALLLAVLIVGVFIFTCVFILPEQVLNNGFAQNAISIICITLFFSSWAFVASKMSKKAANQRTLSSIADSAGSE